MLDTKFELQYESEEKLNDALPVIIVAAGSSSRMNGIDKQFFEVDDMPLIAKTISAFQLSPLISKIILVAREDAVFEMQKIVEMYHFSKVTDIIKGGDCRFSSVLNGINSLSPLDKKVLIHDGARPFVDSKIIGNIVASLQNSSCSICAIPVKDTIKIVDENSFVKDTPQRKMLYSVQTPQGVDVNSYKTAAKMVKDFDSVTDDAMVMELAGYAVKVVAGSYKNIKITTPDDIKLAKFLILEEE